MTYSDKTGSGSEVIEEKEENTIDFIVSINCIMAQCVLNHAEIQCDFTLRRSHWAVHHPSSPHIDDKAGQVIPQRPKTNPTRAGIDTQVNPS